jgi:hypothetical protein
VTCANCGMEAIVGVMVNFGHVAICAPCLTRALPHWQTYQRTSGQRGGVSQTRHRPTSRAEYA